MSVPVSKLHSVRIMKRKDAEIEDMEITNPHFIQNGESKNFSLKRLFIRIRGNAIIKTMHGNMAKNHIISDDPEIVIPSGIASRIPVNTIANILCRIRYAEICSEICRVFVLQIKDVINKQSKTISPNSRQYA